METLTSFINNATVFMQEKIVEYVLENEQFLTELGLDEINNDNSTILESLEFDSNKNVVKEIIELIIEEDFIEEENNHCLFYGNYTADSYTRNSALYVFKFGANFFCHYYPESSCITENPEEFCKNSILAEKNYFEIEKENSEDEYFEDSEIVCELKVNFNV